MSELSSIAIDELICHTHFFGDTPIDDAIKRTIASTMITYIRTPTNLTSIVDGRIFAFTFDEKEYVLKKFRNVGDKNAEIRHLSLITDIKFIIPFCYVKLTSTVTDNMNDYILIMHKKPVLLDVVSKLIANVPNIINRQLIAKHIFVKYMLQLYTLLFHHELIYSDIKAQNFAIDIVTSDDNFDILIFFMDFGSICSLSHPNCVFTFPHDTYYALNSVMKLVNNDKCTQFRHVFITNIMTHAIKEINHGGLLILMQIMSFDITYFSYHECLRLFPRVFMPSLTIRNSMKHILTTYLYNFVLKYYVINQNVTSIFELILMMNSPIYEYFQMTDDETTKFYKLLQESTKTNLVLKHHEHNTFAAKILFEIIYPTLTFVHGVSPSPVSPHAVAPASASAAAAAPATAAVQITGHHYPAVPHDAPHAVAAAPHAVAAAPQATPHATAADSQMGGVSSQVATGGSNKQMFDKYKEYKTKYLLLKQQLSHE